MDGGAWWAAVHGVVKSRTRLSDFTFTFHFPALEKEMATHSSVLAYRIPGTGEPGGLPSMGSHRVRHNWQDLAAAASTSGHSPGSCGPAAWALFSLLLLLSRFSRVRLWPHRWQPTRLPRPWDSPGKNTGVGCHFLLQCMKVKSEREVAQSCPTLHDPMDCSLPGSSTHGIFQARVLYCILKT